MTIFHRTVLAALFTGLLSMGPAVLAQAPPGGATAPTDAQVRELEQQIKSLQQQLDQMNATHDAAARQRLMQQNWQGMQSYIGQMHDRWGLGYPWMMGHSWRMTGPGMMISGARASWPLPQGLTPDQYSQQMRDQMQGMQEQMNKIAQTSDPQERRRLMQEHWQSMYQNMQTMRGMGWMWGGGGMMAPGIRGGMMAGGPAPSMQALPDADSAGAKLVSTYCVQCHVAPQPTLHTTKEWANVTQRMHIRMQGSWQGIKIPSEQEMKTIVAYMQKHARH